MANGDSSLADISGDASSVSGAGAGGGFGVGSALGLGALGAGMGLMLAQGPAQLPQQYVQAEQQVPIIQGWAQNAQTQGQQLVGQATQGFAAAQAGQLTPEEQATLDQQNKQLNNQARQVYASMGRSFDQDTSSISTSTNIAQALMASAQNMIQTNIQLASAQLSGGTNLLGISANEESAANNILMQAGAAQVQLNTNYSNQLAAAMGAVGKAVAVAALV